MKHLCVLIVMMISTLGFGQTSITLPEAIARAKQSNRALSISSAKADAAAARAGEARTALLPSVKVDGSYHRLSDVDPFAVKLPIAPAPIVISPTVLDNYALRVTVQQPLFTGFKLISNSRAAADLSRAARSDRDNDEQDLIANVTSTYWMYFQALETRKSVEENVQRLTAYVRDTERLVKAGVATRNDLLKIQVQLSSARLSLIDASNDAQVAMMNLNNAIGQPVETEIVPSSHPGEIAGAPQDSTQADVLQTRPDLVAMKFRLSAAEASLTAARGNWWPQIFLSGSYMYNRPNVRYQPTRDEFKATWDVGVSFQFDLWNWGTTHYQTQQAAASLMQAQLAYDQSKENALLEIQKSRLAVHRATEKVDVGKLGVEQAEENMRITEDKFAKGVASSTDLLDASFALLQSRTSYTGALVELETARTRLAKSLGTLTEPTTHE